MLSPMIVRPPADAVAVVAGLPTAVATVVVAVPLLRCAPIKATATAALALPHRPLSVPLPPLQAQPRLWWRK